MVVPPACYAFGACYRDVHDELGDAHEDGDDDGALALELMLRAAGRGFRAAECYLGFLFYNGYNDVAEDPAAARLWMERAAVRGDPHAQFAVGLMVQDDVGGGGGSVDSRRRTAMLWHAKSA